MENKGPRNIGLSSLMGYRFPVTAISSILHRISGVLLFVLVPFVVWALNVSLKDQASFEAVKETISTGFLSFILWVFLSALIYHLFAGVRHLLMDIGLGEGKCTGRLGSWIVIILSIIFMVLLGVCLWA